MITERLNRLKTEGNFSWQDLSDLTGIPVPTIRKTFSGETANPSFEVVSKLIAAMGGSMEDEKKPGKAPIPTEEREKDMQAVMEQMRAIYEARISDLWRMIEKISNEKKALFTAMLTIMGILICFIIYLFVDGMHGNWGFFRY